MCVDALTPPAPPRLTRRAAPRARGGRRAYSLLEMLITVFIIQLISTMVVVNVSSVEANDRLDRAANDVVAALRYARMVAMSSGANQPVGVEFNTATSTNYFRVFAGATQTTVANPLISGGTYYVSLGNQRETASVRISSIVLSGGGSTVTYSVMGGTNNNGNVTLTYGSHTKTIVIPLVGDPKIQ